MEIRRHRLGRLLPVVAVFTSLALVAASCAREVTTEEIQGLLEALEGRELVVKKDDGTTVRITAESTEDTAEAALLVGKPVTVQVRTEDDGDRELVILIQRGSDDHFSGVIQSIGAEEWVIGGRTFQIDENTMLDEGLAVGVMVEVESFSLPDGSLTARQIETREDRDFQFSGEIRSMNDGVWVIGGRTFTVNDATALDEGLAVGVEARVEFITMADGTMLATEIETDEGDDRNRFCGEIESMTEDWWVVGGRSFAVNDATRIDGDFTIGDVVRVRFAVIDDVLLATRIQEESGGGGGEEEFVGEVQFIYADSWIIGGMTFAINATTRLEGDLAVGEDARVDFVMIDDSKLATRIRPESSGVSGSDSGDDSSSSSSSTPSVTFTSPMAGATPPAGSITVTVEVDNFTLMAPGGAAVAGQGHLHFYLDVTIPTTPGAPAVTAAGTYKATGTPSVTWDNVAAGSHTFGVQLVNNDHTPLGPPVTATVMVTVE